MDRSRPLPAALLLLCCCGFTPNGGGPDDPRDVSGNYQLTYDDQLTVRLDVGGAVREATAPGAGAVVDLGLVNGQPVTLDLGQFCARPEVVCPGEAFWSRVALTQPRLASSGFALQELQVVDDTVHLLDAGVAAAALGGLVNHDASDRFVLGLGAAAAGTGSCGALALSLAGGRFTRAGEHLETVTEGRADGGVPCALDAGVDAGGPTCLPTLVTRRVAPAGARVDGIAEGQVLLAWAGGCAVGPALVGATLSLSTGFTGRRTGPFSPPPYTPAAVVLPDGGLPDAGP